MTYPVNAVFKAEIALVFDVIDEAIVVILEPDIAPVAVIVPLEVILPVFVICPITLQTPYTSSIAVVPLPFPIIV